MAEYDVPAAVEETAKAVQSISQTSRSLGGYMAAVFGEAPFTAMAIIDDRLKLFRAERVLQYYQRAAKRLREAGIDPAKAGLPSPSIELPLLEGASLEDRAELCELWEKLLASAMAPATRDRVRARHIEIIKRLEPLDAFMLQCHGEIIEDVEKGGNSQIRSGSAYAAAAMNRFSCSDDAVHIGLANLQELRLITRDAYAFPGLTPEGRDFLDVVRAPLG